MAMVLYMLHDLSVVDLNRTGVLQSLCVKLKRSRDLLQLKNCCLLYDIQLPDAMDVWHHLTTVTVRQLLLGQPASVLQLHGL
jgi:hypothetical protein